MLRAGSFRPILTTSILVISHTISMEQCQFRERPIFDVALIGAGTIEIIIAKSKRGVVIKLDMVLKERDFGQRWWKWISGCLNSSCFSVVLNGHPRDWLVHQGGLSLVANVWAN